MGKGSPVFGLFLQGGGQPNLFSQLVMLNISVQLSKILTEAVWDRNTFLDVDPS